MNFSQFIEGFVHPASAHAAAASAIVHMPRHISGWAWSTHFMPQSRWADVDWPNSTFVCYSERLLAEHHPAPKEPDHTRGEGRRLRRASIAWRGRQAKANWKHCVNAS